MMLDEKELISITYDEKTQDDYYYDQHYTSKIKYKPYKNNKENTLNVKYSPTFTRRYTPNIKYSPISSKFTTRIKSPRYSPTNRTRIKSPRYCPIKKKTNRSSKCDDSIDSVYINNRCSSVLQHNMYL